MSLLAVGGGHHGELLPLGERPLLMVLPEMEPLWQAGPLDPDAIMATPEPELYRRERVWLLMPGWTTSCDRPLGGTAWPFEVYVAAGMSLAEAKVLLEVLAWWFLVWRTLALAGVVEYLVAARRMQAEADAVLAWGELVHRLREVLREEGR